MLSDESLQAGVGTYLWFIISGLLVVWDSCYLLLRPLSMPGGSLHQFFGPYAIYGKIDHHYSREAFEAGEGFPTAQMWMNIIEVSLQFTAVFLWACGGKKSAPKAAFIGFSAQLMTLSKTLLYFACDIASNFKYTNLSMFPEVIYLYYVPNGCWIVFPMIMVFMYGSAIVTKLSGSHQKVKPQ